MGDQQTRRVNEAAEKFAESLTEAYRAVASRSVSAQELNSQVTQNFFNTVINNLRTQAESNRSLSEDLIEQQRKQQEASRSLAQESVNAYMDFLDSVFVRSQEGVQNPARTAREATSPVWDDGPGGEEGATQDEAVHHPLSSWMQTTEAATSPKGEERTPREKPPPGEERPERRGAVPTTPPSAREDPSPGEERSGRRTP